MARYRFSRETVTGTNGAQEHKLYGFPDFEPGVRIFNGDNTGSTAASLTGLGFPIGFRFRYDGQWFTRFAVSSNGYIKLGTDQAPFTLRNETQSAGVFASGNDADRANVISALQVVPQGSGGPFLQQLSYGTTGMPGNRVLNITFSFLDRELSGPGGSIIHNDGISCQLELFERTNRIVLTYEKRVSSPSNYPPVTYNVAVGLRGKAANNSLSNLHVRKVISGTNTWNNSTAGTSAGDVCQANPATLPYMGNNSFPHTGRISFSFRDSLQPEVELPVCPEVFQLTGPYDNFPGAILGETISLGNVYPYYLYHYYTPLDGLGGAKTNPTISWSQGADSTYQYEVYFGLDSVPEQLITSHPNNSFQPGPLVPNTTYFYNIITRNAAGETGHCIGHFTTAPTVSMCWGDNIPDGTNPNFEGTCPIRRFYLNDLTYDYSGSNTLIYSFPDVAPFSAHIRRGQTYKFYISMNGQTASGPCNYLGAPILRAYIDYNRNGIYFDQPDERAFQAPFVASAGIVDSFVTTIPLTAELGTTKMNFGFYDHSAAQAGSDACGTPTSFQSYFVHILPAAGCDNLQLTETHEDVHCFGQTDAQISLRAQGGRSPYSYSWSDSPATDSLRHVGRGTYRGHVTDANGCRVSTPSYVVRQTSAFRARITGSSPPLVALPAGAEAYQWYLNGTAIPGATSQTYSPGVNGSYRVFIRSAAGCEDTSDIHPFFWFGIDDLASEQEAVKIFPNPGTGEVNILFAPTVREVSVLNSVGQLLERHVVNQQTNLSLSLAESGVYFVRLHTTRQTITRKVVVLR